VFTLLGLWPKDPMNVGMNASRSIASATDCGSIVQEIINPSIEVAKKAQIAKANEATENIFKLKNTIWNKILRAHEFENFNDQSYFRWIEIYKDASNDLSKVNPVSIEQKMAMIEVINNRLMATPLYAEKNLSEEVQKLNAYKLRKLQKHLARMDLSSKLTRDHLNDFAADFMLILKGPPVSLLDYFTMNKTARMSERLMNTVQEDALVMGLKGVIARIPEKNSYTTLEEGKSLIKHVLQWKIWRLVALPANLPWMDRVKIPDELLEKILLDGLDVHNQELVEHLKKQNLIDHYERFRQAYKVVAYSIEFYVYYQKFNNYFKEKNLNSDEGKKFTMENFIKLGKQFNFYIDSTLPETLDSPALPN
jgi:hypothetical protein